MGVTNTLPAWRSQGNAPFRLAMIAIFVAMIRVFIFDAAFPFFTNIDERAHFDMVVKYARGGVACGFVPYADESIVAFAIYSSEEFLISPERHLSRVVPMPVWKQSHAVSAAVTQEYRDIWRSLLNPESSSSPLYYSLAGGWLRVGEFVGLSGLSILYWVRFINVLLAGTAVWLSYILAHKISPHSRFLQISVPALLACMPQDAFYSIQSDALSPVCVGLTLNILLRYLNNRPFGGWWDSVVVGTITILPLLAKLSNLPAYLMLVMLLVSHLYISARLRRERMLRGDSTGVAVGVVLPLAVLASWNFACFGDIFGVSAKVAWLGWSYRPFSEWWSHPVFSLNGWYLFWTELTSSLWRGELFWHGRLLSSAAVDAFYWMSTLLFLGAALMGWLRPRRGPGQRVKGVGWCCVVFVVSVLFMVFLSVRYNYGECRYPSADFPFFTSGRLLSGVMIPYLIMYVSGLEWVMDRLGWRRLKYVLVGGICLVVAASELAFSEGVFQSQYNWYHMWQ